MTLELVALFGATSGPDLLSLLDQIEIDEQLDLLMACKALEELEARAPEAREGVPA